MNKQIQYDGWQLEFINTKGDKILCTGRQVGKSVICGHDAGEWIKVNKDTEILMIAPTERQAFALFNKTFDYMENKYPKLIIRKGKDKPTKTKFKTTNNITVHCLPVGLKGTGIRCYTIGRLYADEASRIPEEVWAAVTPMLLVSGGDMVLLSTLNGKENRFYHTWSNQDNAYNSFFRYSISTEKCYKERKISETWTEIQRDKALELLKREKLRMSKREYAQEYEAIAMDGMEQFFPTDVIKKCMELEKHTVYAAAKKRSLGADIARMGGDETAIIGLALDRKNSLWQIQQWNETNTRITYVADKIVEFEKKYYYDKLFIDDGGLGAGVVDILLQKNLKRKVRAINNATWSYGHNKKKNRKKIMKEHLYNHLLAMMEQGKVHLWKSSDLYQSLISIQAEWDGKRLKIWGRYSHLVEALVRAAWIVKEKGLNIYVA